MTLQWWSTNFSEVNNPFLTRLSDWVYYTWWEGQARMGIRLTVVCIFFAISGICSSFSRNNALRGVKLAVASVTLSLFTVVADSLFDLDISIVFGVLHCFTVAILLYALLEFLLADKAKYACLGLGILFFVWGLLLDFYNLQYTQPVVPPYSLRDILRVAVGAAYTGADCFGILPYAGIFLIGAAGGKLLYPERRAYLPFFGHKAFRPVRFVGRNAIWFYLLHQPVVMLLIVLLGAILGLRFF